MFFHLATPDAETEAVPVADLRQLKHCLEETYWYSMNIPLTAALCKKIRCQT